MKNSRVIGRRMLAACFRFEPRLGRAFRGRSLACLALAVLVLAGGCRSKAPAARSSTPARSGAGSSGVGDATWSSAPASGDWNTASNWNPLAVPTDTATFHASSQTAITFSATSAATVNQIVFAADASAYSFNFSNPAASPALTIAGTGVSNASPGAQSFVVASSAQGYKNAQLVFRGAASAGGNKVTYSAGPATPQSAGGGVIGFYNTATAGSASFTTTTGSGQPQEPSTVGGEISFSDSSSAGTAHFTNNGTTGTDGDTFGNTVFHDTSTAANATFDSAGGTVSGGDGGNTQFFDQSSAANGMYYNHGGTTGKANGGDVAFDGTANAGSGTFHNYAAKVAGAYGGVTSFNNNPPDMYDKGASAGSGTFYNYGPSAGNPGGGGHTSFSGKHGAPTAGTAKIYNHGSEVSGASGGYTFFSGKSTAGRAQLTAKGGSNGGLGGKIEFSGESKGGSASVELDGNGVLDISGHDHPGVTIGSLVCRGGIVTCSVGTSSTRLELSGPLQIYSGTLTFSFKPGSGFRPDSRHEILKAPNLSNFSLTQFRALPLLNLEPRLEITRDDTLVVTFHKKE